MQLDVFGMYEHELRELRRLGEAESKASQRYWGCLGISVGAAVSFPGVLGAGTPWVVGGLVVILVSGIVGLLARNEYDRTSGQSAMLLDEILKRPIDPLP